MTKIEFAVLMAVLLCAPGSTVHAASNDGEAYGTGLLCPRAESQVSFYTENDQQDAAGTIAFEAASGFYLASDSVKTLKSGEAHTMDGLCDGGAPGIRIDNKRDGWLQAGRLWIPPNQEWDYSDWSDYLRKAAIWKPLSPVTLYQGTMDAPYKEKPYPAQNTAIANKQEIYPIKFVEDYALVLLDEHGAFAKSCAGMPAAPEGLMGWMRLDNENGKPAAVPVHAKGC